LQEMKYYCDRCRKEVKPNSLTTVKVMVKSKETKECCHFPNTENEICDKCLDEIGFDRIQNKIPDPFELIKKLFRKQFLK
jgi:hypothetical protein